MLAEVQVYGLEESNYGWISLGVIRFKKIEIDSLRKKAIGVIEKSDQRYYFNLARLVMFHNNQKIKITIPDIMIEEIS